MEWLQLKPLALHSSSKAAEASLPPDRWQRMDRLRLQGCQELQQNADQARRVDRR